MVDPAETVAVRHPKVWQHGFDYAYLAELEQRFKTFNTHSRSPFSEMNKPQIAQRLHNGTIAIFPWGVVDTVFPRYPQNITCYQDLVIAHKQPGDQVITAFCYEDRNKLIEHLVTRPTPTYLWIWQESADERNIAETAGYRFVACKISSFAEIRGLWFKDSDTELFPRRHPVLDPCEYVGIARAHIPIETATLLEAVDEVTHLAMKYTPHYSNYAVKKTWQALSLRGYTPDPGFIAKPAEMNKKWWDEHSVTIDGERVRDTFELQDTPLRAQLPAVDALHKPLSGLAAVHRIRLMRLTPGGGELKRHTDLVDKDSGIADGSVARFHIPIITNNQVVFGSWNLRGEKTEATMRVGECWYLDTRKPHTAVNNGETDRVHLVVDVESNHEIRNLLSMSTDWLFEDDKK